MRIERGACREIGGRVSTKTKLFWNEGGEIACEKHMPFAGSDTRVRGRWREITWQEAVDFEMEVGRPVACEECAAIARNARAS